MKEVTAVQLRQSVSKVAHVLEKGGGPILLRLGRKPVGVIVSVDAYKEHFRRDRVAEGEALMAQILGDQAQTDETIESILDVVRGRR